MAALTLNTSYRSWSSTDLVNWIISIDPAFENKYKQTLLRTLTENKITGSDINDLDREDLLEWGIINLDDKKRIYSAIQTLIVQAKRNSNSNNIVHTNALSLSDDENMDDIEDKFSLLTDVQREGLLQNGYCMLDDPLSNNEIVLVVQGYIRHNFADKYMILDLIRSIINFYHSRYNVDLYIELKCCNLDVIDTESNYKDRNYETFLIPRRNIGLSGVLSMRMDLAGNMIEIDEKKVNAENMHRVLKYLGHHKGIKPEDIAKPIRSVKMERIVADKWDADYINAFAKKSVFQLILAANYLDCPYLLHLGAAKIATLIKGKSPAEIKNILADDSNE